MNFVGDYRFSSDGFEVFVALPNFVMLDEFIDFLN